MKVPRMRRSRAPADDPTSDAAAATRTRRCGSRPWPGWGWGAAALQVAAELDMARRRSSMPASGFSATASTGCTTGGVATAQRKADDRFDRVLMRVLERTPEDFGWSRPTWTRELLCLQMKREGFPRSPSARWAARSVASAPGSACPSPSCSARGRGSASCACWPQIRGSKPAPAAEEPVLYSDEVDVHLNPKIGRDWMLRGQQRRIVTPGKNQKFYLAGALDVRTGACTRPAPRARTPRSSASCSGFSQAATGAPAASTSSSTTTASTPRIAPASPRGARRPHRAALPAALLPRRQPHRARLAGLPRQRHPQPPLQDHEPAPRQRSRLPRRVPLDAAPPSPGPSGEPPEHVRESRSVISRSVTPSSRASRAVISKYVARS